MSSAVAELEVSLQAMLQLKPPGVSGSRINSITQLCTGNIESESVLIQKLYTHFKKAPSTHKLGVLYVVDSVTRKWSEQAKIAGQPSDNNAVDGTYGAGVNRVKELLPSLMNDIISSAPPDQKDKIRKLVDIWEKGQTFPLQLLLQFKEKLDAQPTLSTTPEGTPPRDEAILGGTLQQQQPSASAARDTSSILAVLANMAKQNQNTAAPAAGYPNIINPTATTQPSSYTPTSAAGTVSNQQSQIPAQLPQGVNVSAPNGNFAPQYQGQNNTIQNVPSNNLANPFAGQSMPAAPNLALGNVDPVLFQKQVMLLQSLAAGGVPQDQWPAIIAAVNSGVGVGGLVAGAAPAPPGGSPFPPSPLQYGQNVNSMPPNGNGWPMKQEDSRDRNGNGYKDGMRSPPNQSRRRSRSRSPQRNGGWARDGPNNNNNRRVDNFNRGDDRDQRYGNVDRGGRGGSNAQYRQRSPPRGRGRSSSPPRGNCHPKWTDFDPKLPKGVIRVLSRTLFVGGVTISESELRSIFDRLGKVQTCIVNKDKRHAFVKMISRGDAEKAKTAMEKNHQSGSMRTRWGVGFGPRDCSDYSSGISEVPIDRLTEADRKWMLSAEYGGTGGLPITGGLVVEEPDIEIGQGVSSKAISRRMQTDNGGKNGPKSGRDYDDDRSGRAFHHGHRNEYHNDDRNSQTVTAPPAVPNFQLPMFNFGPNGFPMFPPNFMPQQNGNGQTGQNGQPAGPPGYHG